ncbi:MAG: glutamate 5-kinase [Rhodospirillaceae bacterium]
MAPLTDPVLATPSGTNTVKGAGKDTGQQQPATAAASGTRLAKAKRVVIKIGSALLVDETTGGVRTDWLDALCGDVARLRAQGTEVILVSSGAIAVGRGPLGLEPGRMKLGDKQAAAAIGQIRLAHAYRNAMAPHGIEVAQILLTLDDSENRRRYLNARTTLDSLLRLGAVPVVNENDTVTTMEIRFGDNDRLSARVAEMAGAEVLVLLSDIDGLYSADPRFDPDARHIAEVPALTPEILAMAGKAQTSVGTGGMVTKLEAARIAMGAGCAMVITRGTQAHPLSRLLDGAQATWFLPAADPGTARKRWLRGGLKAEGVLHLDAGAARALSRGRSLLPAGVTAVEGRFQRGAAVHICGPDGTLIGKGLVTYPAEEARKIMGRKSGDIESLLGYVGREVLVHRDDLVLMSEDSETDHTEGNGS